MILHLQPSRPCCFTHILLEADAVVEVVVGAGSEKTRRSATTTVSPTVPVGGNNNAVVDCASADGAD